jgi:hypothetical protein
VVINVKIYTRIRSEDGHRLPCAQARPMQRVLFLSFQPLKVIVLLSHYVLKRPLLRIVIFERDADFSPGFTYGTHY